jgi:hypothetical protein
VIERDFDTDVVLGEIHLPSAESLIAGREQPRFRLPTERHEALTKECIQGGLPAGGYPPATRLEAVMCGDDVQVLDRLGYVSQLLPCGAVLKDLATVPEVVKHEPDVGHDAASTYEAPEAAAFELVVLADVAGCDRAEAD